MTFLKRHSINIFIADPVDYSVNALSILWTLSYPTMQKTSGTCSSSVLRGKCINIVFPNGGHSSPVVQSSPTLRYSESLRSVSQKQQPLQHRKPVRR